MTLKSCENAPDCQSDFAIQNKTLKYQAMFLRYEYSTSHKQRIDVSFGKNNMSMLMDLQ